MSRPLKTICARCGQAPKHKTLCYCLPCNREIQRVKRTGEGEDLSPRKRYAIRRGDLCNCGDRSCNGMQCQRASV